MMSAIGNQENTVSTQVSSVERQFPAESLTTKHPGDFYRLSREIVKDLFQRKPLLIWTDFLLSVVSAYALASVFLPLPITNPVAWISFLLASVLIYRASMFIHEIVHLPTGQMRGFRFTWNLLAGVPMMVPTFSYESHIHHHSSRHYGTEDDGEYLPLASGSVWGILVFLSQIFVQPLLVVIRYFIGTPISFLHPRLRRWMLTHASSLVINFRYQRNLKPGNWSRLDTFWELMTSLRVWVMISLVLVGVTPEARLAKIYLLSAFILGMNHIRTLAAHRYQSHGNVVSHLEQFSDSTNVEGNWLTELICPLGLRYHALHHLFPGLPYHNLGIAHRRLTKQLPRNSIYHEASFPSMSAAIKELVKLTRSNRSSVPKLNGQPTIQEST